MKTTKIMLFIGLLSTAAFFSSCEKTYTCTCTINGVELKSSSITAKKKKDATQKCENLKVHSSEICKLK